MNRCLPLRHRYRGLLGRVPSNALLEVPWIGGRLLLPAEWLESFSVFRHVVEGERCMPELGFAADLLDGMPPGIIVDVGAHVGQFTLWASCHGGHKIIAFEPDPVARRLLEHTLRINDCHGVRVVGAACGEAAGRLRLKTGLVSRIEREFGEGECEMPVVTLDEALRDEGPITLVKIDVEGFEARVLRGAIALIREGRTNFLIELHPAQFIEYGDRVEDIIGLLAETHDIELWQFEPGPEVNRIKRMLWRYGILPPRQLPQWAATDTASFSSLPAQLYIAARRRTASPR